MAQPSSSGLGQCVCGGVEVLQILPNTQMRLHLHPHTTLTSKDPSTWDPMTHLDAPGSTSFMYKDVSLEK